MFFLCGAMWACASLAPATVVNLYHTNRVFKPINSTIPGVPTAYEVYSMAGRLTEVVGPTNVIVYTNNTFAREYEAVAWGYESANAAWTSVVANYSGHYQTYPGMTYDNVGWIKGTRQAYGTWGGFLWLMQNQVDFDTSDSRQWISPYGPTSPILKVLVSSIGDYPPMTNVVDVGPTNWACITNFLGSGLSEDKTYKGDYTAFYEVFVVDMRQASSVCTLLTTNVFSAVVFPSRLSPTNYIFQVKRTSSSTWYTLTNGPLSSCSTVENVAGHFKVRVTASVNGVSSTSMEKDLEVQFPSYADIVADAGVQQAMGQAWQNTLAATTPTGRREEGFWIKLNAQMKQYEFGSTDVGPVVPSTQGAYVVTSSKPADAPASPNPLDQPTYTVSYFHTHTPTTYRPMGRMVGPSKPPQWPNDIGFSYSADTVGIVYDYTATFNGCIPSNHPLNSASQLYPFGPQRRSTPP